jgi:hypothetical protein
MVITSRKPVGYTTSSSLARAGVRNFSSGASPVKDEAESPLFELRVILRIGQRPDELPSRAGMVTSHNAARIVAAATRFLLESDLVDTTSFAWPVLELSIHDTGSGSGLSNGEASAVCCADSHAWTRKACSLLPSGLAMLAQIRRRSDYLPCRQGIAFISAALILIPSYAVLFSAVRSAFQSFSCLIRAFTVRVEVFYRSGKLPCHISVERFQIRRSRRPEEISGNTQ